MAYKIELLEIEKKNDKLTCHNRKWHYRRLSISLTIYRIITKPISFRSDMGGGMGFVTWAGYVPLHLTQSSN